TAPVADAIITFQNGQITGNGGCNGFFAGYTLDGNALGITLGGRTAMACEDAIMAQEDAILAALGQVASYEVADGQLQLLGEDGSALLTLTAQTATELTGVVWRATNYNNGQEAVVGMLEGTEITAIFGEDGSVSGSAGCNNFVAGFTVDGNQITIGPAASTMMMCVEPEGVMEQEAAFLAALASAATYSVNGQVLEMRTADDAMALRFEVATDSVVAPAAMASADPDPVAEDSEAAPVEFAAVTAETPSGRVTAELGVNIRTGPGTMYPIVGIAPLDTEGEIVGRSADGQWWVASVPSAPNGQGWVAAAYVDASNADAVPVLPAPPLPETTAAIQEGVPYEVPQGVILYSASRVVQEGNRVYELEDIYVVPATAGAQAEMVANNAMQPALSPDRSMLAFYSQQSDKLGVGGYDVATGQRLRFSRFVEDSQPRWSPTGDRIVFASNRQGDRRWRIYITPAVDKERPAEMDYAELDFGKDPDWHPTDELLILKGCDPQGQNCGLYTMGTDGSSRTIFTNVASDSLPRWFPDGSAVVFMSEDRDGNWELYRAEVADGSVTRLTNDPAPDGLPAVSPDGSQIAFVSKRGGAWGLWVMPATGGDATQITAIPGELPDWLRQAVDWTR
ncbi:MAG: META domain-containing protein, partial [Caldilinea sp.]|nr:META domain-containing protein [Caldilinea sp.]